jgi:D-arabinose 1-dehydrogenase-like Zn-dependent alcohol dehydrogenase
MSSTKMQALRVAEPNGPWNLEEVEIPEPGPTQALVKIKACGVCGTDIWMATGKLAFSPFPLSLGHEGVGEVVKVGSGVTSRKVGDRVGVCVVQKGCGTCSFCKEEHPLSFLIASNCEAPVLAGFNSAGGQADYMLAYEGGTVLLPEKLSYVDAAPIMCAGCEYIPSLLAPQIIDQHHQTPYGVDLVVQNPSRVKRLPSLVLVPLVI